MAADGGGVNVRSPPSQKYPNNLIVLLLLSGLKFRLLFVTRVYEASGGSRGDRGDISPYQSFRLHVGGFILYNFPSCYYNTYLVQCILSFIAN